MSQQSETVRFIILVIGFIALAMIAQMQESQMTKQEVTQHPIEHTLTLASLKIK